MIHEGYAGLREIWAKGALKPHISHRFPLAEAGEAMRVLLARKSTGKVVVEVRK
ncbi:MAG: zinc-binding dehydrogenase [Pseudomonadota bacterium]|nr:zinc-binding dehydrogenase [Pseudomonadota bacterium]